MGAMIALLAAAHAFPPAGLAADLMLLGFVGIESALIAHRLYLEVSSVQNEVDLNSAARALEEELASNAAGQLIQHLTGATIKGVAKLPKQPRSSTKTTRSRSTARRFASLPMDQCR